MERTESPPLLYQWNSNDSLEPISHSLLEIYDFTGRKSVGPVGDFSVLTGNLKTLTFVLQLLLFLRYITLIVVFHFIQMKADVDEYHEICDMFQRGTYFGS